MTKALELVGFALIGGTIISFIGMGDSELRWPVFWGCAIGALAIIIYRNRSTTQSKLHRQIYKGLGRQIFGEHGRKDRMVERTR